MNSNNFQTPYTAETNPEVCFILKNKFQKRFYSDLSADCKTIVDDIVTSSSLEVFKQWDTNFKRKYYTKAIFMAYELGKQENKSIFSVFKTFIRNKLNYKLKN
jgi:hypothetical protein